MFSGLYYSQVITVWWEKMLNPKIFSIGWAWLIRPRATGRGQVCSRGPSFMKLAAEDPQRSELVVIKVK